MPNFKDLIKNGIFTDIQSSIPEISSVSWSSIITGDNPGQHGQATLKNIIFLISLMPLIEAGRVNLREIFGMRFKENSQPIRHRLII